jgi:hypothetical protein
MKYFLVLSVFMQSLLVAQCQSSIDKHNVSVDLGHKWVMFVITITNPQEKNVYTTSIYNVRAKGLVQLQETINKMKQCLIADASKIPVSIKEISISEFKFSTYEEGEEYFKKQIVPRIHPMNFPASECATKIVADL